MVTTQVQLVGGSPLTKNTARAEGAGRVFADAANNPRRNFGWGGHLLL